MEDCKVLNPIEKRVSYYLEMAKTGERLSREDGYLRCASYLRELKCRTVLIKIRDDFKWDWYIQNYDRLKAMYNEEMLDLETLYVANLYQSAWDEQDSDTTLLANSLGQLLRQEMVVEDISKYPIEWMILVE